MADKPNVTATLKLIVHCLKLKDKMLSKGLRRATAKCPREGCGGRLRMTLNGKRNHLHCACDNEQCTVKFME